MYILYEYLYTGILTRIFRFVNAFIISFHKKSNLGALNKLHVIFQSVSN